MDKCPVTVQEERFLYRQPFKYLLLPKDVHGTQTNTKEIYGIHEKLRMRHYEDLVINKNIRINHTLETRFWKCVAWP